MYMRFVLAIAAPIFLTAACSGVDEPLLRDHYVGKSILQPDKMTQYVKRDGQGNPILEPQRKWWWPFGD